MFNIRKYEDGDLEQIQQIDFMMWLCLQWNGVCHKEDAFVAEKDGVILGAAALFCDGTWYYLDKDRMDIEAYRMQFEIVVRDAYVEDSKYLTKEGKKDVERALLKELKRHFGEIKQQYPDKKLVMRCWCEDTEKEDMQMYLEEGLSANSITWVLGEDLKKEIPVYDVPEEIKIGKHDFDRDGMKSYMEANELGYDGVADAEEELRFRLCDEDTAVFTAMDGDKVVSSTTVWSIDKEIRRSATENVFTIPEYRHQNIGRATLAYALQYLKDKGENIATLTCVGDNLPAINMYLSMGFELKYFLVEMHYTL